MPTIDQRKSVMNKVGVFAASLFIAATAVYVYSPTAGSHAGSNVDVNIGEILAMSTSSDSLALESATNNFVHGSLDINVSTNNNYGYTLSIEDVDNNTSMTHADSNVSSEVTSVFDGAKLASEMADNTWGFSVDDTGYYKIPLVGHPVALRRTTSANADSYQTTSVDFGVKVGANLTSGTYIDTVKFTAYVNGQTRIPNDGTNPTNLGGSTYSYDPCADAPYVSNGILTDPRDGTEYTVKGLRDGQCWMTQNMHLADITIDSTDSDMPSGMTYTVPAPNGTSRDYDVSMVANARWTMGNYQGDWSYLYNYYAATAGTGGTSLSSGKAPASLCPKGWRLPKKLGDQNEYERLAILYGDINGVGLGDRNGGEANLSYHGIMYSGGWTEIRTQGGYWTSNVTGPYMADFYNFNNAPAWGVGELGKALNLAVRCIAR